MSVKEKRKIVFDYESSDDDDEWRPAGFDRVPEKWEARAAKRARPPSTEAPRLYTKIVEEMPIDPDSKDRILTMIEDYESNSVDPSESYKMKKYLDAFVKIPFGKLAGEEIKPSDTFEKKRGFLAKIKKNMDDHVFGQDYAKNMIIEVIAKRINNPDGPGNIIALSGPPGVGKTSLIRSGLANAYGVPFNFVSLGGARHTNLLKGTDYSFIGSGWGKIVDILIKSKCMDPIIFFDELDKISMSDEGLDIVSSLVHLTDPSQNSEWEDLYYSGIPFDLSKATIIFSLNNEDLIPEPLLDRLTVIKMKGFGEPEKMEIARKYCIPKLCRDIGFRKESIIIPDDTVRTIIKTFCKEDGVRKLEKCIRTILMKFNYFDMVELGRKEFDEFGPYQVDPVTAKIILEQIFT